MIDRAGWATLVASAVLAAVVGAAAPRAADAKPVFSLIDPLGGVEVGVLPSSGVLHVVYFATWCPECVEELPDLAELEDRWTERDYRLLLVAVNTRQTAARLGKFIEATHPPGRLLFDADGRAERLMKVEQLPTHVLVGPDGTQLARAGSVADIREPLLHILKAGGPGQR